LFSATSGNKGCSIAIGAYPTIYGLSQRFLSIARR
jgi:hypothetical protein